MDKYINAKLDSFNFSKSQKELFIDIITYVATKAVAGGIDLSNFATKNDLHNSVHGLELDINTVRDTAAEANRIANNNIDKINNINNNIIPNFYTKTETDKKVDDRIQQVVGAAPEALDTLEEIATRLEGDSDAINAINGVLEGKVSNTTFNEYKETVYTKTEAYSINQVDNLLNNINTNVDNKIAQVPKKFTQLEDVYLFPGDIRQLRVSSSKDKIERILGAWDDLFSAWKNNKIFVLHKETWSVEAGNCDAIVSVSFVQSWIVFSYITSIDSIYNNTLNHDGAIIVIRVALSNGNYANVKDVNYIPLSAIDYCYNQIPALKTHIDSKANIHIFNNINKLTNNSTFEEASNVLGDISHLNNTINNGGIFISRDADKTYDSLTIISECTKTIIGSYNIKLFNIGTNELKIIDVTPSSSNFSINVYTHTNITDNNFNQFTNNIYFKDLNGICNLPQSITTVNETSTLEQLIQIFGTPSNLINLYDSKFIFIDIDNIIVNVKHYDNYSVSMSYISKEGAFYILGLQYDRDANNWVGCSKPMKYDLVQNTNNIENINTEITQINDKILEYHPVSVDTGSGDHEW